MKKILLLFLVIASIHQLSAQDTFSICAVDTVTGEIGSAGASCVYIASQGVMILSYVSPGVGAVHAQAYYLPANKAYAISLMSQGVPPSDIIDSLVANDAQGNPTIRQYGIVDFREGVPSSAAYTGENCDDYKNHIVGPNYSIQGNILLGQQILDSMEARFLAAEGELVCRLMEALQGANVPGADTRCLADGTSSIGAFLRVAKPDDEPGDFYFEVNLPSVNEGVDPIDSLQTIIDQWGGCDATGVEETSVDYKVKTYPNPSESILIMSLPVTVQPAQCKVIIYDAQGRVVERIGDLSSATLKLNTSGYPTGVYFFQLRESGELRSGGKFMVR